MREAVKKRLGLVKGKYKRKMKKLRRNDKISLTIICIAFGMFKAVLGTS